MAVIERTNNFKDLDTRWGGNWRPGSYGEYIRPSNQSLIKYDPTPKFNPSLSFPAHKRLGLEVPKFELSDYIKETMPEIKIK